MDTQEKFVKMDRNNVDATEMSAGDINALDISAGEINALDIKKKFEGLNI